MRIVTTVVEETFVFSGARTGDLDLSGNRRVTEAAVSVWHVDPLFSHCYCLCPPRGGRHLGRGAVDNT